MAFLETSNVLASTQSNNIYVFVKWNIPENYGTRQSVAQHIEAFEGCKATEWDESTKVSARL